MRLNYKPLHLLRNPALRLVWAGQTVSKLGNGVSLVVLSWTVYRVTGSPLAMGLVMAANMIPQLAFVLYSGMLADRFSRRTVVVIADGASGLVTCALAVGADRLTTAWLIVAALFLGAASAAYGPAYRGIVADLVQPHEYGAASGLLQASANVAQVAGPAIAGFIFAFGGATAGFGFDAVTFAVAIGCMVLTRLPIAPVRYTGTAWSGLVEGVRFACRHQCIRSTLGLALGLNALAMAPFVVLLPPAVRSIHQGSGLLSGAIALELATAAVASLLLGHVRGNAAVHFLGPLAAVIGAGVAVLGLSSSPVTILLAAALVGVGLGFEVIESTLILSRTPADLVSRVFSLDIAASFAVLPLAYLMVGVLADSHGARVVLVAGGLALVGLSLLTALTASSHSDRAASPLDRDQEAHSLARQ